MTIDGQSATKASNYDGVCVIIPCHNEEFTIEQVVNGFQQSLPGCSVVVADNNSSDGTAYAASLSGASVIREERTGKGFAIRRLFADVEADCYVMVDGDATYDARIAPALVDLVLRQGIDMVNGQRVKADGQDAAYRRGHEIGNRALTWIFQKLFRLPINDTLSGYRVMSRRFVKSFPTGATGFEIEAELNAHAAVLGVPVAEVPSTYYERPKGSESKLNTYRDGIRITRRNLRLFRDARPNLAFLVLSVPWLILAAVLVGIPLLEYLDSGEVTRFPSLIAGTACMVVALLLITAGLVMERIARNRIEAIRLAYLGIPGPVPLPKTMAAPAPVGAPRSATPPTPDPRPGPIRAGRGQR